MNQQKMSAMEESAITNEMSYYGGTLCISAGARVSSGVMSNEAYKSLTRRDRLTILRRGGGRGQCALVSVDSLPERYKTKVLAMYPGDRRVRLAGWVRKNYEVDQGAVVYFSSPSRCGFSLPPERVREYIVNASVLNTCIKLYDRASESQKLFGGRYDWGSMSSAIESLREQFGHTLPSSTLRFRGKVAAYKREGYPCLVSGKFGNQSARKVDFKTERLILSLAARPNKPFNTDVSGMYNMFVRGELEVFDLSSGELFRPCDFVDSHGRPLCLSEATIQHYLSKPGNKVLLDQALMSRTAFMHESMPHVHRHGGDFSLSQVTMDDVDLTRKLKDTKQRVHAYYAYDVVSQCVLGASYSRRKDESLVLECFRDMFRLVERNGWGMPAGIEVENHLMSQYKEGFLKAGVAFPFVHFCAPQNSQEKYAEPLNGAKKRSVIHKNHEGIGRFYGKGKWRAESQKVSDETNELYEDKEYFSWDQLVAEDRRDNEEWNHQLHPDQKRFPGMTRWDVLCGRVNPSLQPLDKMVLARYIGERVETSVRRNSTVRVCHEDWWLSDPGVLEKLRPNDYKVTAFYMPDEDGKPTEVYIFQGDKYIDKVEKVETYNRVMSEQTDEDVVKYVEQQKKISKFEKYVRDRAVEAVGVLQPVEGEAVTCDAVDASTDAAVVPAAPGPSPAEEPTPSQPWFADPIGDI